MSDDDGDWLDRVDTALMWAFVMFYVVLVPLVALGRWRGWW